MTDGEFRSTDVLTRFAECVIDFASPSNIAAASLGESARIVSGPEINGVTLNFLDLSSLSHSGTFKDWVACLTMAYCLETGVKSFVTQSSGNTANALALYAVEAGVEIIALYPRSSRYKINPAFAEQSAIILADVDQPEPQLKLWTDTLAEKYERQWLPRLQLQRHGNKLRAYILNEWSLQTGQGCDWHAQALSSAFGPIGTYTGYRELAEKGELFQRPPKFLGLQQEAVHPFVDFLTGTSSPTGKVTMIEPTLFRTEPTQNLLDEIAMICSVSGGTVQTVSNDSMFRHMVDVQEILADCGLSPVVVKDPTWATGYRLLEIAGLICLAGVLGAIEQKLILKGESVMVVLTGGFGAAPAYMYQPAIEIRKNEGFADLLARLQNLLPASEVT